MINIGIQVKGAIILRSTEEKNSWHNRKGYYVGERWVKPRRIKRKKKVAIKPYLFGILTLIVPRDCVLFGSYKCTEGRVWVCRNKRATTQGFVSWLEIANPYLGEKFIIPEDIQLLYNPIGEKC
jgi:hypothetical protein